MKDLHVFKRHDDTSRAARRNAGIYIRDNEQMMNPESSIPEFLILWLKIINNIGWVSASKSDASNLCCKMDFLSTKARSIFVCHQLKYFFFFLCH